MAKFEVSTKDYNPGDMLDAEKWQSRGMVYVANRNLFDTRKRLSTVFLLR